jgi:Cu(I)/Ag(I) efflux system membrane fusion protein
MAWFRWILIGVMGILAALSVTYSLGLLPVGSASAAATQYYCPMHPQVVQDHPGDCPICSMSLVPKEGAASAKPPTEKKSAPSEHQGHRHNPADPYFCPMHPEETGLDETARCPLCKMKLEKRAPSETAPVPSAAMPGTPAPAVPPPAPLPPVKGLAPVTLALDRVQLIGVRTAQAEATQLAPELKAVGFVTADEAKLARVHARFSGWVERLSVRTTGEKVRRGQVLAGIYNLELLPAQQEFLAARRWAGAPGAGGSPAAAPAIGSGMEQDARARLALFGMSPGEIESIAKSGKPTRTVAVSSPMDGFVVRKAVVQGDYIQPGTALFEIAELSKVWVLADIYEQDMARVAPGQAATVSIGAYPNESFLGKVGFVYPTLDPTTRTLRVRIELDNRDQKLRPGMYANVLLQLSGSEAVVIPSEALVDTGDHQYVFVAKEGGRFEPRAVRAGSRLGDKVQIVQGLSAGETVVTTGNFLLDSESRLQAAIQGP